MPFPRWTTLTSKSRITRTYAYWKCTHYYNDLLFSNHTHEEDLNEEEEEEEEEDEEAVPFESVKSPGPNKKFEDEMMEEIEEMREEVDEARKLAEEWESKYKDMQRQMSEVENCRNKKNSLILDSANFDFTSSIQPKTSHASEYEGKQFLMITKLRLNF